MNEHAPDPSPLSRAPAAIVVSDATGTCTYAAGGAVAVLGLVPKPEGRPLGGPVEPLLRRGRAGEALVEQVAIDDHTFGISVTPLPDGGAVAVALELGDSVVQSRLPGRSTTR